MLTPAQGKLHLLARGVRKEGSRLAAGIELFTVTDINYVKGKGDLSILTSARIRQHFDQIVQDIERVQLGYDLIKIMNRATEDQPEAGYFTLLELTCQALNNLMISTTLIRSWFFSQLLRLAGHVPNLKTDSTGQPLEITATYSLDAEQGSLSRQEHDSLSADHIKVLRLLFADSTPTVLYKVGGIEDLLPGCTLALETMLKTYIRI
jgi:DNA repair protein RecO (recombination protein O)